jgi:hypothetical protein
MPAEMFGKLLASSQPQPAAKPPAPGTTPVDLPV